MDDVIIIGGSYAGLAAALQLARAHRRVLILDAGQRRNRFASHSHGFLGQDGQPPDAIAAKGRAEVLAYPTVTWRESLATEARAIPGGFAVRAGSDEHTGKRLILATGVVDDLPAVPGLAERWGKTVFPCPYCDGYELHMGRLGVLATSSSSAQFAVLVSEWAAAGQMTFFVNGGLDPDAAQIAQLASRNVHVEREAVVGTAGEGPGIELLLRDGRTARLDAVFLHPQTHFRTPFAEQLGLELDAGALGPIYKTDATKETNVPGVFACGDVALPRPTVAFAVADGVRAGMAAHQSLVFRHARDLVSPAPPDAEEVLAFWFGELDGTGRSDAEHRKRWFTKSPPFDAEIRERFGALHAAALAGERDGWLGSRRGRLAFVIVLDQLSRNLFRGTGRMFEADARALEVASLAIKHGDDRGVAHDERSFLYMPFMHSEEIGDQERCVELFAAWMAELEGDARSGVAGQLRYAEQHRDIVRRFGRFPHRNALLGRASEAEETTFLAQPGSSF